MVITLDAKLAAALTELADKQGVSPEGLALDALRQHFLPAAPFEPQDDWGRRLLSVATDCGVSLPNSALSREELYD